MLLHLARASGREENSHSISGELGKESTCPYPFQMACVCIAALKCIKTFQTDGTAFSIGGEGELR